MDQALKVLPGPEDRSLRLATTDVDGCVGPDHEVIDVSVEESETEVVIDASLNIGEEAFCEVRSIEEGFAVELDRPLGRRLVIDNSRGDRSVIWSPEMRRDALERIRVGNSDAEAFVRSRFPAAENADCHSSAAARFTCILTARSFRKQVVVYVLVQAGAELKALTQLPREKLPPELRTRSSP